MKLETALITNNSPYAEVRAVVDNKDDPSMPVSTIRAWTIGILFSLIFPFVNQVLAPLPLSPFCTLANTPLQLFNIRQPPIVIQTNVAQLLAYPLGKAWAKWVPSKPFNLLGNPMNLNPGPFNKKEHMLIAIMAGTSSAVPYTNFLFYIQVLPQYFNQPWAKSFTYMSLIGLSTNFIGYGLAGKLSSSSLLLVWGT